MDINRMTQKMQEGLQNAHAIAVRNGHQEVDGEHLLLALLEQEDGLAPRLLDQAGVSVATLRARLEQDMERRPKVSGGVVESGKVYVTQRINRLLLKAEDEAKRLKDEYVSVEHVLLAFIEEGDATAAGRLLRQAGATPQNFLEALTKVRGNQRVTSPTPEASY